MNAFASRHPDRLDSLGYLLWLVSNQWQQRIRKALKPFGLTHVQFVLLAVLASEAVPITQRQVATLAATDPMMTSQVLRTLEERGYLTRSPGIHDRRARLIAITDSGLSLVNKAVRVVEHADADFFGSLGDQQEELLGLLQHLLQQANPTQPN